MEVRFFLCLCVEEVEEKLLLAKSLLKTLGFELKLVEVKEFLLLISLIVAILSMWKPEQLKNDANSTRNIKHTHFTNDK